MTADNNKDIKKVIQKWLSEESGPYSYVGDTDDLSSITLDGEFNLTKLSELLTTYADQRVREERERILFHVGQKAKSLRRNEPNDPFATHYWELYLKEMVLENPKPALTHQDNE